MHGATARIEIRSMGAADEDAAMQAEAELGAEGHTFLPLGRVDREPWQAYLERVERARGQKSPHPEGRVPWSNLYLAEDGVLAAGLSLRHELTPWLREVAGHVGYVVRPAWRRRGHAGLLLAAGLHLAAERGMPQVLLTCDDGNIASARVIESAGGVLEDVRPVPGLPHLPPKRRYWIETGQTRAVDLRP